MKGSRTRVCQTNIYGYKTQNRIAEQIYVRPSTLVAHNQERSSVRSTGEPTREFFNDLIQSYFPLESPQKFTSSRDKKNRKFASYFMYAKIKKQKK